MHFLCPKEVAGILGVSDRSARRLMSGQDIASFRIGTKSWRTTRSRVAEYAERQFERYRRPCNLIEFPAPKDRSAEQPPAIAA